MDAFVSTGTGILGHNMFAYCNNNPVVYVDNTGAAHVPGIDACGPVSHKYDYGTTFSFGGSLGYTSGNYSVNETYVISSAKNRNEIQKTTSEGTAIGIGASIGVTFMITNANSIYDLRGQSNSVGATLINFFGITIDYVEFNPKSNSSVLCWGLCFTLPVGVETEIHEYTCNTEKIKQWETPLSSFLKKILSRWEE